MSRLIDFPLRQYIDKWHLAQFIETGTFEGAGIKEVIDEGITNIFSCDVQDFFIKDPVKFSESVNVNLYIGRSVDLLPKMLKDATDDPALIFLDAHCDPKLFRGFLKDIDTDDGDPLPLLTEVKVLTENRDISNDVIIVDDLHLYVKEMAVQRFDGWKTKLPPIQFKTVKEYKAAINGFFPNHDAKVMRIHDVSLLLTPKG